MTGWERILELVITIVLIVGGYQFYFWAQRQTFRPARYIETAWDRTRVFDPRWVWVYSGLYYPAILVAAYSTPDWRTYAITVGCFLTLLAVQVAFFISLPVAIPVEWRINPHVEAARTKHPHSMRMLDLVWSYDKLRNSMPSMHVSVATMVDLTIWKNWPLVGHFGVLFPILIGVSAIKTRQHYLWDIPAGAITGLVVFFAYQWAVT